VTLTYSTLVVGGYRFTGVLSPFATTRYNIDPDLDALGASTGTAGYTRLDARLSLATPDGRGAVDIIGKNLTDHIIGNVPAATLYLSNKEEPRNVAVQVRYSW
jgi:hypothetical protein